VASLFGGLHGRRGRPHPRILQKVVYNKHLGREHLSANRVLRILEFIAWEVKY
jgi:hypothetical protein